MLRRRSLPVGTIPMTMLWGIRIVNAQNFVCSWLYLPNVVPNRALANFMPMFIEQWMHCDRSPFLCWCSHLPQAASSDRFFIQIYKRNKVSKIHYETIAVWKDLSILVLQPLKFVLSSHLSELFPMATTGPGKVDDVVWWSLHSRILTIPFYIFWKVACSCWNWSASITKGSSLVPEPDLFSR